MEEPPAKRPRRETDLKDITSPRSPRPHDSRSGRYEDDGRSTNGYNRRYRDDEDRKPRRSRSPAREKHDPNATGGRRRERSREGDRDSSYRNNRYRDRDRDRDRDRGSRRTDREDEKDKPTLDRKRRRSRSLSHSRSRSRTPPLGTRVNGVNNNTAASTSNPAGGPGSGASNRSGVGKRNRSPPRGPSGPRTDHDKERGRQQRGVKKEEGGARAGVNGIVDIKMHEDEDEDAYMKRIMGFEKFRSTKNTKVPGNQIYAVRKEKKTEYRQYMNRVGGFNRPLSPSR